MFWRLTSEISHMPIALIFVATPAQHLKIVKFQCQLREKLARFYVIDVDAPLGHISATHAFAAVVPDNLFPQGFPLQRLEETVPGFTDQLRNLVI